MQAVRLIYTPNLDSWGSHVYIWTPRICMCCKDPRINNNHICITHSTNSISIWGTSHSSTQNLFQCHTLSCIDSIPIDHRSCTSLRLHTHAYSSEDNLQMSQMCLDILHASFILATRLVNYLTSIRFCLIQYGFFIDFYGIRITILSIILKCIL